MTQEEKFEEAKRLYETANADQRYVLESLFPELKESESEDERIRKELIKVFTNRKELVKNQSFGDITISDILAWLEKQGEHYNFCKKIQVGDHVTRNEDGVLVNLSQLKRVAKKDEQILANSAKTCKDEQKPAAWSDEDEKRLQYCVNILQAKGLIGATETINTNWLKSLKDRVQPQPKQEWSEEDKRKIDRIYSILRQASDTHAFSTSCRLIGDKECIELQDFLKSLRPQSQWKPSERQKEALLWCVVHLGGADKQTLGELLEELNKL